MSKGHCLGVIPVRMKSSRLPNKPLKDICGKSLVLRVWEQARKAKNVTEVVIATENQEIFEHAQNVGAHAIMTKDTHLTGSDRVAEVLELYTAQGKEFKLIANIQGDMPFIRPEVIDSAISILHESPVTFGMSTISTPILLEEEFMKSSAVKVVLGNDQRALYFSRAPILFWRERSEIRISEQQPCGYKHMGLYVFRPQALRGIAQLPQSLPEQREKLEQLRALCGGINIKVAIIPPELVQPSIEVDTPGDLERARQVAVAFK